MGFVMIVLTSLLIFVLGYLRHCYNYWERHGVKQLRPHFLFGHIFKLKSVNLSEILQETYDTFKGKTRIAGVYMFTRPIAIVTDLDLVKAILIKDFNKFVDRTNMPFNMKTNPLAANLFSLHGDEWRALRAKLTPTFTSGKMKYMFSTVTGVADQLEQAFLQDVEKGGVVEVHDLLCRYTVDVIGSCAFGIKCNSLKDPQAEFRVVGREIFNDPTRNILWTLIKSNFMDLLIKLPFNTISTNKHDHTKFFLRIVRETVESRERQNIKRNDFMDLLLELRKKEGKDGLSVELLAAQVFLFFIAGFETSASNMSYALFEMAQNHKIQNKLRTEILTVLEKHGKLTYEAMMEMPYLDQVISETLRKYPPLAMLQRMSAEDYKLPDDKNFPSDSKIVLERGIKVFIPVRAIHHDPEIYPEPNEYRPERFDPAACQQRHPVAFLGFGDGPRNCIGLRFGRMEVKVGLITLLTAFKFSLPVGAPTTLTVDAKNLIMIPNKGVRLCVERL